MLDFNLQPHFPRCLLHELRELQNRELLGELVENPAFASRRGFHAGKLDATYRVTNVEKASRLPAFAIHGERMADRSFDAEAVQHRTEYFIVIEPIDKSFIQRHFIRQCS